MFDPEGNLIRAWGETGSGPGQFNGAGDLAITDNGYVYVTDIRNNRVQKFDADGRFIATWYGSSSGWLHYPNGVATAPDGNVYVADSGNDRIQVYTAEGEYLFGWGRSGTSPGEFSGPRHIEVDAEGNVFVSEFTNHRIQKFDLRGHYRGSWGYFCDLGIEDACDGGLYWPLGLAADGMGDVYVVDFGNHRVAKFDDSGRFICTFGEPGLENGQFVAPQAIATAGDGRIYVVDQHGRVQAFTLTPVPALERTWGALKARYR